MRRVSPSIPIQQNDRLLAGKVINETEVVEPQQVAVKVRIASMARTVTQQLGINCQTIGNGISIGKFLF